MIGGVWCDTETGEVKYGYQDFDHMNAYGELPTFSYFAKPPLTIESPDEIRPVSSPDGSIKLWHYG